MHYSGRKDEEGSAYHQLKDGFEEVIENITSQKDIDDINLFSTTFVNQKLRHQDDIHRIKAIRYCLVRTFVLETKLQNVENLLTS